MIDTEGRVTVRTMKASDLGAVVTIDERVTKQLRRDYYEQKFARCQNDERLMAASLVAEVDGKTVGFVLGEIYVGEFGIPESTAMLDTIGVDPRFRRQGVARALFEQLAANLRAARVSSIHTLVSLRDGQLLSLFDSLGFRPSRTINLELPL